MHQSAVTAPGRVQLRGLRDADHRAVLEANAAEVPRVGPLDEAGLASLLGHGDLALVAELDGHLAGFVLAIAPGASYASPNYRAFEERGTDHLYVDRVVVLPGSRRRGVATALYDAVEAHAVAAGRDEVTCEVNLEPPNPVSLAFHDTRGFTEVGRQWTGGGAVQVALLARPVTTA